jgi:translation initiation factor 2 beta subunit (eIF-2beta)/eIF-5
MSYRPSPFIAAQQHRRIKRTGIIDINHDTSTNLTDASNYTSTSGADITIASAAALDGTTNGLNILIDDTTVDYGQKTVTTNISGKVRTRFYVDPNALTMANTDAFYMLYLYRADGNSVANIKMRYLTTSGYDIQGNWIDDTPAEAGSAYYVITDAPHYIEFYLTRAATNVSVDGSFTLWIDGTQKYTKTNIDNYDRFTDFAIVRIGGVLGIDAGTSGNLLLDELIINDTGEAIGP